MAARNEAALKERAEIRIIRRNFEDASAGMSPATPCAYRTGQPPVF